MTVTRSLHCLRAALCAAALLPLVPMPQPEHLVLTAAPVRKVNAPYLGAAISSQVTGKTFSEAAIFWFGRVTPSENYADVRVGYFSDALWVYVAVIDRRLWYDETPGIGDLEQWDAVTLFLDTDGNIGDAPDASAYRFVAQFSGGEDQRYRATFRGNGTGWQAVPINIRTLPGWRGDYPNNDNDDSGWAMTFIIPFAALGISSAPHGQTWGLAMRVHDRDGLAGPLNADKAWPETMQPNQSATWGRLHFGLPGYAPASSVVRHRAVVYHGHQGVDVPDGAVGGYTTCGAGMDFWTQWGERVYYTLPGTDDEYGDFNIQNQSDISDYPCFSKYYVTFPLPPQPPGLGVFSATLNLHLFGSAGDSSSRPDSLIQVLTVNEDWDERTLSWNNAPLAVENVSRAWVQPVTQTAPWPGIPYRWDVSYAVAQAYAAGRPLRLAMYSADDAYHSGKYFVSSDTGDWNAAGRPRLDIAFGEAFSATARVLAPIVLR